MTTHRKERLEELIRQVIGDTLLTGVKDPRIGFATVTRVELSRDYSVANVFISIMGTEKEQKLSMAGLESAKKFIQRLVGKAIQLRVLPRVNFIQDKSIEEGVRLVGLIDEINRKQDERKGPEGEGQDDEKD
ncbi:MAG: 30S ribosome-binding factor RbfA [Spirochaetes bacterium]|nr:MAG: 30S ribosome-binding factor RbfA [Spirochaetota bacterium]